MLWLGMAPITRVLEQSYGGQRMECGGLNMLDPGNGTIRRKNMYKLKATHE